jgi:hypothetical protein
VNDRLPADGGHGFLQPNRPSDHQCAQLCAIAGSSEWFMDALVAARELALPDWCIGACAVRNLVWDALHGWGAPSTLPDVDVVYFDLNDMSPQRDKELGARLAATHPAQVWEVCNQAGVHHWFEAYFGHAVAPLVSLDDAVASWPEFATCVGISLEPDNALRIIAPHGLDDLFAMVVRHNPRASVDTYRERVDKKRFQQRWPMVTVL